MNAHEPYEAWLPFYVAGTLGEAERAELERHLADCPVCQADLALWGAVAEEVERTGQAATVSPALVERALAQVQPRRPVLDALLHGWQLLCAQARLVQRELWPASAAVMLLGVAVALLMEDARVVYFLAPLAAAASLAVIYGSEYDPGLELALSTPTSPWKILLARLSLVSGYNLLITLAASLALLVILPPELVGGIILGWLGPMTFLSALALLLSLWWGTSGAIAVTYGLWLLQYQPLSHWLAPAWVDWLTAYQAFWRSTPLQLVLALVLVGAALLSAARRAQPQAHPLA